VGIDFKFHKGHTSVGVIDEHGMFPGWEVPKGPLFGCPLYLIHVQGEQQIGKLGFIHNLYRGGTVGEYALTTVFHYGLCPNVNSYSDLSDHIGLTSIGILDEDHIGLSPLKSIKEHGI